MTEVTMRPAFYIGSIVETEDGFVGVVVEVVSSTVWTKQQSAPITAYRYKILSGIHSEYVSQNQIKRIVSYQ